MAQKYRGVKMNVERLIKSIKTKWTRDKIDEIDIRSKLEHEKGYLTSSDFSPINPRIFHLELSSSCNLNCTMCPRGKLHLWSRKNKHLPFSLVKKMYERGDFSGTKALELFGFGEPTLNPEFKKITRFLSDKGIYLSISTNGQSKDIFKTAKLLLDSGLDYITIPLDSFDSFSYRKIRIGGTLYHLLNLIFCIFAELKIRESKKFTTTKKIKTPVICLQMIEMEENKDEFPRFKETCEELFIGDAYLKELYREDKIIFKTVFLDTIGSTIMLDDENLIKNDTPDPCISLWYGAMVLSNGDVVPCDRDFNGRNPLGNLHKESFHEIFNGEKMRDYRRKNMIEGKKGLPHNCKICQERNLQNMRFIPWLVNNIWNGEKPI
jgi:radical SAM protein with 4Fe4S-binding SPASM domain